MELRDETLLICRVGAERYAIEGSRIAEVMPLLPLWRPPTLPIPLAGFVRVRGEALPVLALRVLLGGAGEPGPIDIFAHLLRPHGAGGTAPCLLVDRCEDIVPAATARMAEVDPAASRDGVALAQVELADGGVAHLLSLERLLDEAERARIDTLTREASRRAALWEPAPPDAAR